MNTPDWALGEWRPGYAGKPGRVSPCFGSLSAGVLIGSRDLLIGSQVGKEGFDPSTGSGQHFGGAHLYGMALVVEEDVAFNPIQVGLFGAVGIVPQGDGTRCLMRNTSCPTSRNFFGFENYIFSAVDAKIKTSVHSILIHCSLMPK
jgi:hypothetical protein